jgi:hypothetical protein
MHKPTCGYNLHKKDYINASCIENNDSCGILVSFHKYKLHFILNPKFYKTIPYNWCLSWLNHIGLQENINRNYFHVGAAPFWIGLLLTAATGLAFLLA